VKKTKAMTDDDVHEEEEGVTTTTTTMIMMMLLSLMHDADRDGISASAVAVTKAFATSESCER
jgi:hypothetical protein